MLAVFRILDDATSFNSDDPDHNYSRGEGPPARHCFYFFFPFFFAAFFFVLAFFFAIQSHLLSSHVILRDLARYRPYFFFLALGAAFFVAFFAFFLLAAIQSHPLSSWVIPRDSVREIRHTL